jgi:hypothetical protein
MELKISVRKWKHIHLAHSSKELRAAVNSFMNFLIYYKQRSTD